METILLFKNDAQRNDVERSVAHEVPPSTDVGYQKY
jgi:hypothetical protein